MKKIILAVVAGLLLVVVFLRKHSRAAKHGKQNNPDRPVNPIVYDE